MNAQQVLERFQQLHTVINAIRNSGSMNVGQCNALGRLSDFVAEDLRSLDLEPSAVALKRLLESRRAFEEAVVEGMMSPGDALRKLCGMIDLLPQEPPPEAEGPDVENRLKSIVMHLIWAGSKYASDERVAAYQLGLLAGEERRRTIKEGQEVCIVAELECISDWLAGETVLESRPGSDQMLRYHDNRDLRRAAYLLGQLCGRLGLSPVPEAESGEQAIERPGV